MARINIESEVAGNVWKVQIAVGDIVSLGQELLILESMKMEIPVEAPSAGRVIEVRVAPDEAVAEDQVLLILETL